jgi:hypothetical protein
MRTIKEMTVEGFTCTIVEDDDGRVFFTADADKDCYCTVSDLCLSSHSANSRLSIGSDVILV